MKTASVGQSNRAERSWIIWITSSSTDKGGTEEWKRNKSQLFLEKKKRKKKRQCSSLCSSSLCAPPSCWNSQWIEVPLLSCLTFCGSFTSWQLLLTLVRRGRLQWGSSHQPSLITGSTGVHRGNGRFSGVLTVHVLACASLCGISPNCGLNVSISLAAQKAKMPEIINWPTPSKKEIQRGTERTTNFPG